MTDRRRFVPDQTGPTGGVRIDRADAVITVTIATPRGALDHAAKIALRDHLHRIGDDPAVRAVILTGSGTTFCAGQDLREHAAALSADATAAWETLRDHYNPIVTSLATMPKPVIAAVNGVAAGAGAAFAFACDLRLLAEGATFHPAFAAIGLSADSGLSWTLPRLVGHGRAVDLLLRGRPIDAASALELGLATEVMPAADLPARAAALARELAAGPTAAYAALKRTVAYSGGHGLPESLEVEAAMQTIAGTTEDHAAAVAAFLAKRAPEFRGA